MSVFDYKAKDKNALTVSGEIDAQDRADAVERLHELGLVPVSVVEQSSNGAMVRQGLAGRKPRAKEVYLFTRQLSNLIKAGIPILRALEIIALQQKNRVFREIIETARVSIQQGRSLSEALAQYPRVFPGLYVAMLKAGEESGNLKDILLSLAEYQRSQDEILSKVRAALAYPLLMLLFGVGTVFFILTYVLPQITKLFDNLEQALPLPTLIVMKISSWLTNPQILFGLVLGGLLLVAVLRNFLRSQNGRTLLGQTSLKVPLLGSFLLKVDLARFSRTLELLLKSGVPIVRAIKLAIPVVGNEVVRQELNRCHDDLVAGKSFGESLRKSAVLPDIVGYFVTVGEESGSLSQTLNDIAENYEQDIQETLKVAMTLLEPLMIVVVGSIVGFIIMAMLLPIFQMDMFAQ